MEKKMITYKYYLDLRDVFKTIESGQETTLQVIAKTISARIWSFVKEIKNNIPDVSDLNEKEIERLAYEIEECDDADLFDELLLQLYDWADEKINIKEVKSLTRRCWVATVVD
jgi:hypothetical protein